jgi:hypothetical protein
MTRPADNWIQVGNPDRNKKPEPTEEEKRKETLLCEFTNDDGDARIYRAVNRIYDLEQKVTALTASAPYDPNNARHVVAHLNDELISAWEGTRLDTDGRLPLLEFRTDSNYDWIALWDHCLWDSEDNRAEEIGDTDTYETIEKTVRLRFDEYLSDVCRATLMPPPAAPPSKTGIGLMVAYGGHDAEIPYCDITQVGGGYVVRTSEPVTDRSLRRPVQHATHRLSDHLGGFWRPDLGVFVVPEAALTLIPKADGV